MKASKLTTAQKKTLRSHKRRGKLIEHEQQMRPYRRSILGRLVHLRDGKCSNCNGNIYFRHVKNGNWQRCIDKDDPKHCTCAAIKKVKEEIYPQS